jgi:phage gp46-like protein
MSVDIRLVQNTLFPKYPPIGSVTIDWLLLDDGTLDDTQALCTAVVVALGTDKLADPWDELPDPDSTDRRGWWGDLECEEIWDGWPIGSHLWLLQRAKILGPGARQGATVVRVENYIRDAIQPFLDRRIGSRQDVVVSKVDDQRIDALVRIYRGPDLEIELRYQILWSGIKVAGGTADIGEPLYPL